MTATVTIILVGVTSLAAYLLGIRTLRLSPARLPRAAARAMECLGLTVLFAVANLVLGAGLLLGLRAATGRFVSVYVLNDVALTVLSFVQALLLQWWRATEEPRSGPEAQSP
jgi:hypothetical protein